MKPPSLSLGYNVATPSFDDTRRVLFVDKCVQNDSLEEQPLVDNVENINELVSYNEQKL